MVADRGDVAELLPTESMTLPLPEPPPLESEIHPAEFDAIHAHSALVVTATLAVPPPAETLTKVGDTL